MHTVIAWQVAAKVGLGSSRPLYVEERQVVLPPGPFFRHSFVYSFMVAGLSVIACNMPYQFTYTCIHVTNECECLFRFLLHTSFWTVCDRCDFIALLAGESVALSVRWTLFVLLWRNVHFSS